MIGPVGTGLTQVEPIDIKIQYQIGVSRQQFGFSLRKQAAALANPQDAAEHVATAMLAQVRSFLTTTDTVIGVDAINPLTKEGGSVSWNNQAGSVSSEIGPGFLAASVSLKGERRTRYGQGRFFLPARFEAWYTGDIFNAAGLAALNGLVNVLVEAYVDNDPADPWRMINWHRLLPAGRPTKGPTPLPEVPATFYDVASVRINTQVTSLKSRKQTVGS